MHPERIVVALSREATPSPAGRVTFHPFRPGIEIAELFRDANGAVSALLRYAPGASVPRHRHEAFEQVFVLEGVQEDEEGSYPAGTLVVNPPGYEHSVSSSTGCLVLVLWQRPVAFT